ncbi:MAG: hypothetical protein M3O82_00640 [Verrucomicrobiota bacterium]|nr:hypothetical protein [Verrucomicrobiota bacterium]
MLSEKLAEKTAVKPRTQFLLNPYVQISVSIVLSAAAQLLMKRGADSIDQAWLGFAGLRSMWVWLGILAMVGSLLSWLYALRFIPLNIAFNLAGFVHVLVPVGCWLFLAETISPLRWCGISLVVVGVLVIARPLMKVENRL